MYRIDDLAREAETTVRNVRAYQDRGLLPRPRKEGRVALYSEEHLARLRLIGELLSRGHTLAGIKELLEAWEDGRGLEGVLGLVVEATSSWSDEVPVWLSGEELLSLFGTSFEDYDPSELRGAIDAGLLSPDGDGFTVPSMRELRVGAELHAAGVPLKVVLDQMRMVRADMERMASRFMDMSAEHIWSRYLEGLDPGQVPEAADLVRRLRPLAQAAVDAELARAMRLAVMRYLGEALKGLPRSARTEPEADAGQQAAP